MIRDEARREVDGILLLLALVSHFVIHQRLQVLCPPDLGLGQPQEYSTVLKLCWGRINLCQTALCQPSDSFGFGNGNLESRESWHLSLWICATNLGILASVLGSVGSDPLFFEFHV